MSAFRLVSDDQAGPAALGVLTPPGRRTLLIVRPRALAWDLVVVHSSRKTGPTTAIRDFGRDEAEAAAEGLYQALQRWSGGGPGRVEVAAGDDGGFLVRAEVGAVPLLVCPREPGRPYRPLTLPRPEAEQAAAVLRGVLCPPPGAGQEVYFNRRNFSR